MKIVKRDLTMFLLLIILIIPIFFGTYNEFLDIRMISFYILLVLILGIFIFLIINKLVVKFLFDSQSINKMREHDVLKMFITKNNKKVLITYFLMIMIIEELIFRYYLIGFLSKDLSIEIYSAIFISSIIFSLYHVHMWFDFRDLRILLIYLCLSFFLGLYNGYVLITLGIFPCIIIHYSLALYLYYSLYKRTLEFE